MAQQGPSFAQKAERTIVKMSTLMVTCFLIAWTPYAIVSMGATYGNAEVFSPEVAVLPALFAKSSCCYNPVIYIFMNKQVPTDLCCHVQFPGSF